MSKNQAKQAKQVQPLSENTRKAIIIAAIVAVAIIILSISLALILKPDTLSPSDQTTPSTGSSSLPIKNGDFVYTSSDDTSYPLTAQNWSKRSYKEKRSSTHDFSDITTNEKVVMGIVDIGDNWNTVVSDLENEGITGVTQPKVHETLEAEDTSVYMIATKEATTAAILSESTTIGSGKSVLITVWLNTQQLAKGTNAVVMVQKSTVSAKKDNWYAYEFAVNQDSEQYPADENGWQKLEFYIFNRESSSKYIRVSVGIGNIYSGEDDEATELIDGEPITGEGILFVDDISMEEVTANAYREQVDADGAETSTMFKIIENEDIVDKSEYLDLDTLGGKSDIPYTDANVFAEAAGGYSPFTNRDDFYVANDGDDAEENPTKQSGFVIHELKHDGSAVDEAIGYRLTQNITAVSSLTKKDHHHISFWIRVTRLNMVARANIYVQTWDTAKNEWVDLTNGSWTKQTTSEEIDTDSNCGWVKYDIYIKPSAVQTDVSIWFVFGNKEYTDSDKELKLFPNGTMYVTSPAYEKISYKDYSKASSGSYVKKLDLVGNEATASTTVANGSFSDVNNSGIQPESWYPAFAGDNSIYKDGRGNEEIENITRLTSDTDGSGVEQYYNDAPTLSNGQLEDKQQNVLHISNKVATSFGYISSDITLSARTAYVFSVLAKTESLSPYIYLLNNDTSLERSDRVIAKVEGKVSYNNLDERALGQIYASSDFVNGWTRYYIIVVTGNESQTVRLALFNGSLDGSQLQQGSVFYDSVELTSLGSYYFVQVDEEDEEYNEYYETHYKVEWSDHPYIMGTKENIEKYGKNFGELLTKKVSDDEDAQTLLDSWGIAHTEPTSEEFEEMSLIPKTDDDDDTTNNGGTTTDDNSSEVDWALLFSVISSVALVAALLVVVVVRYFRGKGKMKKAA